MSDWIRPSSCESSTCVEVQFGDDQVTIRNSQFATELAFTHYEWAEFIDAVKEGQFDIPKLVVPAVPENPVLVVYDGSRYLFTGAGTAADLTITK